MDSTAESDELYPIAVLIDELKVRLIPIQTILVKREFGANNIALSSTMMSSYV